jgi:hypothetical protein
MSRRLESLPRKEETKMKRFVITTAIGCLLLAAASFAQDDKEGKIQQRKENQQQRVGNGVKNGSLTAGETSKLEHQESKVNKEVRTDRKANGAILPTTRSLR